MFTVDRQLPISLPAQIAAGVRELISSGQLRPGDRVPSSRELARQLAVSRGSVVTAFDQLLSEGFLLASQGSATVVHPGLPPLATTSAAPVDASAPPQRSALSLKASSSYAGTIRPTVWRRAWREAAAIPISTADKSGQPALRTAIAEHLRLTRGLAVNPDEVIVTGGARDGLLLILMSLGQNLRVGVEDPGHPGLKSIIPLAGHTAVTCATDEYGLKVATLPTDIDALLVTPSHLFPYGTSMPATRRAALLTWAAQHNVVTIEDDFNSELRYRVSPQPTLASLATDASVITLGTFSTLLSKQFNAGYVLADFRTIDALRSTRETLGMPVSTVTQFAIAYLLEGGYARRNTKALHKRFEERRKILHNQVVPVVQRRGGLTIQSTESLGADLVVTFSSVLERNRFESDLHRHGVEYEEVDSHLLLSFGHLSDDDFSSAIKILARLTPTLRS